MIILGSLFPRRLFPCVSPHTIAAARGFLLESLGYLKEPLAAIALDLMPADVDRIQEGRNRSGLYRRRPRHFLQPRQSAEMAGSRRHPRFRAWADPGGCPRRAPKDPQARRLPNATPRRPASPIQIASARHPRATSNVAPSRRRQRGKSNGPGDVNHTGRE